MPFAPILCTTHSHRAALCARHTEAQLGADNNSSRGGKGRSPLARTTSRNAQRLRLSDLEDDSTAPLDLEADVLPILVDQTDFGVAPVRLTRRTKVQATMSKARKGYVIDSLQQRNSFVLPPPSPEPGAPRTGDGSPTSFDPDAFMDAPWNEEMGVGTETTVGAAIRGGAEQHKQMREQSDRGWFTHLRKEAVFSAPRSVASFRDQVLGERTWNVDTEADDFDPFRSVTSAHGSRAGDGGGSVWGGSTARHVRRHTPSHMHDSPHREDVGGPFAQLPMSVQLTWRQVLRETSSQCVRAFCVCAGAGSSHVCVRVRVCFARVQPSVSVEAHPSEADQGQTSHRATSLLATRAKVEARHCEVARKHFGTRACRGVANAWYSHC